MKEGASSHLRDGNTEGWEGGGDISVVGHEINGRGEHRIQLLFPMF